MLPIRLIFCAMVTLFLGLTACNSSDERNMNPADWHSGYRGDPRLWRTFLECWNTETLAKLDALRPPSKIQQKISELESQLLPPAKEKQIEEAERHLSVQLPRSLKDFWRVSGGLLVLNLDAEDGKVFGPGEVAWLPEVAPNLINDEPIVASIEDEEYFDYSRTQDPANIREKYVKDLLVVSEVVDAGLLALNPKVRTKDGEWEAWFFGWELPGAMRFRSFAHLMRYIYLRASDKVDFDGFYTEKQYRGTCADSGLVGVKRTPPGPVDTP